MFSTMQHQKVARRLSSRMRRGMTKMSAQFVMAASGVMNGEDEFTRDSQKLDKAAHEGQVDL